MEDTAQACSPIEELCSRLRALLLRIDKLPGNENIMSGLNTHWYPRLLKILALEIEENLCRSERALEVVDISVSALAARNLLELLVWTRYCLLSGSNALRFQKDFIRDSINLNDAMRTFFSAQKNNQGEEIVKGMDDYLAIVARVNEMSEDDDEFTNVRNAAKDVELHTVMGPWFFEPIGKLVFGKI
jgi:hypothetical protein